MIKSDSFGRVVLTGVDAEKFRSQVKFGRPKKAAVQSMERGLKLLREFEENNGSVKLTLRRG